jgi:hypothetical protein
MIPVILLANEFVMSIGGLTDFVESEFGYRDFEAVKSCKAFMDIHAEKRNSR